jgi:hypothetical protein
VFTARYALSPYIKQTRFVFKGLISTDVPYAALLRKYILPEDGRIVTVETCRTLYKCNCAVVGFIDKLILLRSNILTNLLTKETDESL